MNGTPSAQNHAPEDQRFAKRKQSRTPANISHPTLGQPLACTVLDSSSTGALVEIAPLKGAMAHVLDRFPKEFALTIPVERVAFDCRLVWQNGRTLGLRYARPSRQLAKPVSSRPKQEEPKGLMETVLKKAGIKVV